MSTGELRGIEDGAVATSVETAPEPAVELSIPARTLKDHRWTRWAERYTLIVLFGIVLVAFSLSAKGFASGNNFKIVLGSQATLAILAIASIIPLVSGQFDLTVGANLGASAIVVGTCMSRFHLPLALAIVVTMVWGLVLGSVNGILVTRYGLNSLIVTLAGATVLEGLVQWYTAGLTIQSGISHSLINASNGSLAGIPKGIIWLAPVVLLSWYVLEQTPWGRHLTAIGSNREAARLVGVGVKQHVFGSFVASAVLSSLAGVLAVGQSGDADPSLAQGAMLLAALAAAFLGTSAFRPGQFNVRGTVVAVYVVAFSVSGFEFLGAASWIEQVFDGLALIGAVTATTLLSRRRR